MSSAASEVVQKDGEVLSGSDTPIVDTAYKVFLVARAAQAVRTTRRHDYSKVSEHILINHGVYISPEECSSLAGKYSSLIRRSSKYEIMLTIVTFLVFMYVMELSRPVYLTMLLLSPLVLNFYSAIVVNVKLLMFNPRSLVPSAAKSGIRLRSTAIVIASRNEPFLVAKMTFDSAFELVCPAGKKEIVVVDNSDTNYPEYSAWKEYVESFTKDGHRCVDGVRVVFVHRDGVEGFKPRNLDMALEVVSAELMFYLDVDSTIRRDTLLRIAPMFDWDDKLGFVQLYTMPTNPNGKSSLAFVQSLRNYFLRLEMVFLAHASHSLFFGHNAIWRTSVVRQLGSCLEYHRGEVVVTEDLSMSLRARNYGYYGTGAWLESGEWVPESLRETEAMWLRWTVGTCQVYSKHFAEFVKNRSVTTREFVGWIQNIGYSINYGLVPFYAGFGLLLDSTLLMLMVVMSLLPEVVQAICAFFKLSLGEINPAKKAIKVYSAFFVLGTFINWVRCIGLLRYLARVKQGWTPTGKSSEKEISLSSVIWERGGFLVFGLYCVVASGLLLVRGSEALLHTFSLCLVGLYGLNTVLCVLQFGKARMHDELSDAVGQRDIEGFSDYYVGARQN